MPWPRHIQIPDGESNKHITETDPFEGSVFDYVAGEKREEKSDYLPFVVCCRFDSSMTSKLVPNSRLRRVPVWRVNE